MFDSVEVDVQFLFLIAAIFIGLPAVASAQMDNESEAQLHFIRDQNIPVIAKELYRFRPDGWIKGRTREGNTAYWALTAPQSIDNIAFLEPELAEDLGKMAQLLGPDGAYRKQTLALLAQAGFAGSDLDSALEAGNFVWSTKMGPDNALQVGLKDGHVFFVIFYGKHCCPTEATNVPVDGAIVVHPDYARPEPDPMFVSSPEALEFKASREYARCGQQALLDAGFDPNGVDGAPGGGATRAISKWAEDVGIFPAPVFTRSTASQVCHVLTAAEHRFTGSKRYAEWTLWPLWSGDIVYNENSVKMTALEDGLTDAKANVVQFSRVDFGDGPRFGDRNNADLPAPWTPVGSTILHGQDGIDGIGGDPEAYTLYATEMLRLVDAASDTAGMNSLEQMFSTRGDHFPNLRKALGATDIGRPLSPESQVLWTIVDETPNGEVVAADVRLHSTQPDRRHLIFMEFDPSGEMSRLLYASVGAFRNPQVKPGNQFPTFDLRDQIVVGLFDADCRATTASIRSQAIRAHDGFSGFPVRLCFNDAQVLEVIVWTKTSEGGDQLFTTITLPNGDPLPVLSSYFDEQDGSNVIEVGGIAIDGVDRTCVVVKPSGGIAVLGEAQCS